MALARKAALALWAITLACLPTAQVMAADGPDALKDLMGTYLGRATVKDHVTGRTEQREIDIVITPFRSNGFRIRWVNVTLVEGRRDLPGVKRRVSEVAFTPDRGQRFYVEAPETNVFGEREEVTSLGGEPVRWAVLDSAGLSLYSLVVLDDGRYELQTYNRRRTPTGIDLHYERVVDGERLRTIEGRAVKAE